MQMLRFPHLTKPERRSARSAWVLEDGDLHAADLRAKVRRAFPGLTGLVEELFYFRVPVDAAQERRLVEKIADRSLWGTVLRGFVPPRIALGRNGEKDRVLQAPRDERKPDRPRPLGFVVDPGTGVLWVPLYLDHVARVLADRLMVIEYKSMSRFSFRRAVMGDMGYKERAQLAVIADALALDTLWLLKCKDTAHQLEVMFLADADAAGRTRVTITRTSGQKDTYWVPPDRGRAVNEATGEVVDELREDESWDMGEVWTPYDRTLLDQVRARILRVLLYEPPADPVERLCSWFREAGPDFTCKVCDGTGTQTRQKNRAEPLKKPKPCEDCGAGQLDEVQLPAFPCGYAISPDTPILQADFTWARAEKLAPGDTLCGFEEVARPRLHGRKVVPTVVEAVAARMKQAIRVITDRGTFICSPDHPWLVRWGHDRSRRGIRRRPPAERQRLPKTHWREAGRIRRGMAIYHFCDPTEAVPETDAYMAGYIRGLTEGDGNIRQATTNPYVRIAITDHEALDRLAAYLAALRVPYVRKPWGLWAPSPTSFISRKPIEAIWFGGRAGSPMTARLLGWPLDSREAAAGYLGGLYDAEGTLTAWSLRIAQRDDSPVIPHALEAARALAIDLRLEPWRQGASKRGTALRLYTKSLLSDLVRFFALTRPAIARKTSLLGRSLYNSWATVIDIEPGPEMPLIDLQTSSKTFIAGGFASHNCPVVLSACYPMARLEVTDKPRYYIKRADYEAAGITFTPPEGASPVHGGAPPAGAPGTPGVESTAALPSTEAPGQPPPPLLPEAAPAPTRFTFAGKTYETAGITREQLVEAFRLASAVANRCGPNRSSTILATFGAANFLALTAETADLYLAALRAAVES